MKILENYSDGYGVGMITTIQYDNHIYNIQLSAGESDYIEYYHIDNSICYVISINYNLGYKGLQLIDMKYIVDKAISRTQYSYIQCRNITYYPVDSDDSVLIQGENYQQVENMSNELFINEYSILLGDN